MTFVFPTSCEVLNHFLFSNSTYIFVALSISSCCLSTDYLLLSAAQTNQASHFCSAFKFHSLKSNCQIILAMLGFKMILLVLLSCLCLLNSFICGTNSCLTWLLQRRSDILCIKPSGFVSIVCTDDQGIDRFV